MALFQIRVLTIVTSSPDTVTSGRLHNKHSDSLSTRICKYSDYRIQNYDIYKSIAYTVEAALVVLEHHL